MSWDNVWPLPRATYSRAELERAVTRATTELGMTLLPDEDEGDGDDEWDDDDEGETHSFTVSIPRAVLAEHDDDSREACECVFSIANEGDEDEPHWAVSVFSNEAMNREASSSLSMLASRVSVLLGGSEDCEPL